MCEETYTVAALTQAKNVIIRAVQEEMYAKEVECIRNHKDVPRDSPLYTLNPFTDENGLLRVGGRLCQAKIAPEEKNPIIVP